MSQRRSKTLVLAAMCLAAFMSNLDDTVVNVALPRMQMSFGTSVSGLQWILAAYTLPLASLVLASGALSDLYGRKRVFLAGLVTFTLGSAVCGLAPRLEILIVGRALQGIGASALLPGSLSILTTTFTGPKEKAQAFGIWSAVSGIASAAGPALGGLLVDTLGWQSVFFLNLPLGVMAFGVTSRSVQEVLNPKQKPLDLPGILLGIICLASLTYALIESSARGWRSPLIVSLLIVAGLSLLAFLAIESRSPHPLLPLHLFSNRTFTAVNAVSMLVFFTLVGLLFIFSLFLQNVQGYSATAAGIRFLPLNAAFIIASVASGWVTARLGWRSTITIGLVVAGVALLLCLGIDADTPYAAFGWNLILSGFGIGLTLAPLTAAAMSAVPLTLAGIASAVLNTSTRLGSVLGIALQGTLLSTQLTSELEQFLVTFSLPAKLKEQILAQAVHGGSHLPSSLPTNLAPLTLRQAINNAFVSGMHAALIAGSVALLAGTLLTLAFVQRTFEERSYRAVDKIKSPSQTVWWTPATVPWIHNTRSDYLDTRKLIHQYFRAVDRIKSPSQTDID